MPLDLDLTELAAGLVVSLLGGAASWFCGTVLRLRRDVDAAFSKIRALEKELGDDLEADSAADPGAGPGSED